MTITATRQLIWQQRWQICGRQVGYICTLDSVNKVRITVGEAQSLEIRHTTQNDLRVLLGEWFFSVVFHLIFFSWRLTCVNETLENRTIDNVRLKCCDITTTAHCLSGNNHETECAIWCNHSLTLDSGQHNTVKPKKKETAEWLSHIPQSLRVVTISLLWHRKYVFMQKII